MKQSFLKKHSFFCLFITIAIVSLFSHSAKNLFLDFHHYISADERNLPLPPSSPNLSQQNGNVSSEKSEDILQTTIKRLDSLVSLSASVNLKIYLDRNNAWDASGIYKELKFEDNLKSQRERSLCYQGTTLFRLHINIPQQHLPHISSSLEDNVLDVICDRNSLWTYTSIEGEKRLTEIKLNEMAQILSQSLQSEEEKRQLLENGMTLPGSLSGFPGLGGISGMLRRLDVWYAFPNPPEMTSIQSETGTRKVWKIKGQLKEDRYERIKKFLTGDDERPELLKEIPFGVEIFIGIRNPFPYHIRYYSVLDEQKKNPQDLMTVSFTDIYENLNTINPEHFVYVPGGLTSTDVTHAYLQQLIPNIEF